MNEQLLPLAINVGRTGIAFIDGMSGRGAIKGEELLIAGQLREQCNQITLLAEQIMKQEAEEKVNKTKK